MGESPNANSVSATEGGFQLGPSLPGVQESAIVDYIPVEKLLHSLARSDGREKYS